MSDLPPEKGVVVGSFVRAPGGSAYPGKEFQLGLRNKATRETATLSMKGDAWSNQFSYDFHSHADGGMLFALVLPAGEYELYTATSLYALGEERTLRFTPNRDASIPFEVVKEEAVYIGQIRHVPETVDVKDWLGVPYPGGGHYRLSNEWERDARLLEAHYPDVDWSRTRVSTLHAAPEDSPLFLNGSQRLSQAAYSTASQEASQPVQKAAPAQKKSRPLFYVMGLFGAGDGGDTLIEFIYSDGDTASLTAGGTFQLGGGVLADFTDLPLQLQTAFLYQGDRINAANGRATFDRFSLEALGYYKFGILRLGGGPQYIMGPEFKLTLDSKETSITYGNSLGFVLEGGIIWCGFMCTTFNLRYAYQGYTANAMSAGGQTVPITSNRIDGSQFSGNLQFGF
jgi:hypothetical protein